MINLRTQGRLLPMMAGLCLATLAGLPAAAHSHHHRAGHWLRAAPAAGIASSSAYFGPTSPGASSILIDAKTGAVISGQGEDVPRYPASLTKLMTLDLAFQALAQGRMTLDTQIPVSYHAQSVEPVKLGLVAGQTISVHDAILAMTTMSANDAATALGEYLGSGSEVNCAGMMTLRAHALGMAQTRFANASGLPNPYQVTTARDLAILARDIVINYPQFQGFFEVTSFDFEGRQVYSNNQMLKTYAGATGMKTGYTDLARHNLVTSAMRNGRALIGVELHEPSWGSTYTQMTAMLDSGFGGYAAPPGVELASISPAPAPPPTVSAPVASSPIASISVPPPVQRVATASRGYVPSGWVAQLGLYSRMAKARTEAIAVRQMRGVGVARIARVEHNGHMLWTAQLAGLSYHAAHETCDVLAARGAACHVLPPGADHLAMLDSDQGS